MNPQGVLSVAGPTHDCWSRAIGVRRTRRARPCAPRRLPTERIDIAGAHKESAVRSLDERLLLQSTGELRTQLVAVEEEHGEAVAAAHATRASNQARQRARRIGSLWGLLLVFAGGGGDRDAGI